MTTTMETRELELRRMTIPQLKSLAKIPSKFKRKDEIIEFLLNVENVAADRPAVDDDGEDQSKRVRIAPIFSTSGGKSIDCDLCSGKGTVWCELGIARCPLCRPAQTAIGTERVSTPPLVKFEKFGTGPYGEIVVTDAESGEISIRTDAIFDKSMLLTLVSVYGYGICESIEALMGLKESEGLDKAVERLIEGTRDSAENYSLAQAQLNSEEARDSARSKSITERKSGREKVVDDLSVLNGVDENFCQEFSDVMIWILADPIQHAVLVYDYLVLRRDSVKWFKDAAKQYFERSEKGGLDGGSDFGDFFRKQIADIQEAVYSLPSSGGAIPDLFRNDFVPSIDDEIEMVSVPTTAKADVVTIEE